MSNIAVCPDCDRELKVPQGAEGRKIRCPSCKTTLLVSDGELLLVDDRETGMRAERPERRSYPDDDDADDVPVRRSHRLDEDDYPRKRRKRSRGGIPLWVWLTSGGVLVVAAAALLMFLLLNKGDGYEKIKTGMTEAEVIGILGNPTESAGFGNV